METIRLCKECGAVLPVSEPGELCAACVGKPERARSTTVVLKPEQFLPHTPTGDTTEFGRKFGAYQLIRPLGKGGMGAVYEAEETESGRRVALKVLSQALDSREARQRFFREGRLAASVNHPNSVYIFGTEEVEGQPVITMELVTGGTLQERVLQRGPLPVTEAVEAILDVIAGLEAAASIGVLHRDVKPSNCFIEADGTVKIGDFGLSKSTTGKAETELTMAESFMGTPAFSSPEQLRGDELTVASDIYAVGVTLYFVLTGHLPFESDNMVRLLAMALERPPDPPDKWRPELPGPLNKIVLRCLAKQPSQRFKSYADLRRALAPFSKVAPTPATLSLRVVAGVLDKMAIPLVAALASMVMASRGATTAPFPTSTKLAFAIAAVALGRTLYFAVTEHLWGASPGKLVCALRVVDSSRSFPSWKNAFARASIFSLLPVIPGLVYALLFPIERGSLAHAAIADDSSLAITALLFVAARRSNGFAALHDWLSGTRVIERSAYNVSRPLAEKSERPSEAPANGERFGPYVILQSLQDSETEQWFLGLDTALARKVWIRKFKTPGVPAVGRKQRGLHRSGRLRWLNGRRSAEANWDAYEALSGQSFSTLIAKPQSWGNIRLWLLDLAQELDLGIKDGSTPDVLSFDRVWITATGHAKILDFQSPGLAAAEPANQPPLIVDDRAVRRFLRQLAYSALEGRALTLEDTHLGRPTPAPLPPHGVAFFRELADFLDLSEVAHQLRGVSRQPAAVTRQRKLMVMIGCGVPAILVTSLVVIFTILFRNYIANSDLNKVEISLKRLQELKADPDQRTNSEERSALETYVAAKFDTQVVSTTNGFVTINRSMDAKLRALGAEIKAGHPTPSAEDLAKAESTLSPLFTPAGLSAKFDSDRKRVLIKAAFIAVMVLPVGAFLGALIFRRGIVLRVARIEIVTRDGALAWRWRILCRSFLTWAPLFLTGCFGLDGEIGLSCWIFGLIFLGGAIGALITPERSLADRIMATWLAPA